MSMAEKKITSLKLLPSTRIGKTCHKWENLFLGSGCLQLDQP